MACWSDDMNSSVPKPDSSKHISFMACVNAVGDSFNPVLMFEGVRAMSRYTQEWP